MNTWATQSQHLLISLSPSQKSYYVYLKNYYVYLKDLDVHQEQDLDLYERLELHDHLDQMHTEDELESRVE